MSPTLMELLEGSESTLGDPYQERTVWTQLHALKIMMGNAADDTWPSSRLLMGRTGFNEVALEDTFIQGLPQSILSKVYSQTSLPSVWTTGRPLV